MENHWRKKHFSTTNLDINNDWHEALPIQQQYSQQIEPYKTNKHKSQKIYKKKL